MQTAIEGIRTINPQIIFIIGIMLIRRLSSTNHQYSERRARPLNVAYLPKQVLIDSKKLIIFYFFYGGSIIHFSSADSRNLFMATVDFLSMAKIVKIFLMFKHLLENFDF